MLFGKLTEMVLCYKISNQQDNSGEDIEGFSDSLGRISLYDRHGSCLASSDKNGIGNFDEAFKEFKLLNLFPDARFSLSGEERTITFSVDMDIILENSLAGHIIWTNSENQEIIAPWFADRIGDNVFLEKNKLPKGIREYADDDEGYGFVIQLPNVLTETEDFVTCQRIAIGIEKLIYMVRKDESTSLPQSIKVNNIFSKNNPTWSNPSLPYVRN